MPNNMVAHTALVKQIMLTCSKGLIRLFRNEQGAAWQGHLVSNKGSCILLEHPRHLNFGLVEGSGDLIGWRIVTITPDMVGKQIAQFTSIEVKTGKGRLESLQQLWHQAVSISGGCSGTAKSVEDAETILNNKHWWEQT